MYRGDFLYYIADYTMISKVDIKKEIMSYGVKMTGVSYEWEETKGKGIKVGIIDTGVDLNHPDLAVKEYINFTTENSKDVKDEAGHGTHVAGIVGARLNGIGIVGVAPESEIYVAKAFDGQGKGDKSAIRKSLEWMIEKQVDIVNMSYSSSEEDEEEKRLIKKCIENNIFLVAAAGNRGERKVSFPGRYDGVVAVSSVDINKAKSDFSSYGNEIDLAAAGVDILSTYKNASYAVLSGTSMAAPLISGSAAIVQAKAIKRFKRKLSPKELRVVMGIYADNTEARRRSKCCGCGIFSFGRIK